MTSQYLTVRQVAESFPAFSESSIRYFLFHRESNGLQQHVRNIGRKILISSNGFEEWINSNGGAS